MKTNTIKNPMTLMTPASKLEGAAVDEVIEEA